MLSTFGSWLRSVKTLWVTTQFSAIVRVSLSPLGFFVQWVCCIYRYPRLCYWGQQNSWELTVNAGATKRPDLHLGQSCIDVDDNDDLASPIPCWLRWRWSSSFFAKGDVVAVNLPVAADAMKSGVIAIVTCCLRSYRKNYDLSNKQPLYHNVFAVWRMDEVQVLSTAQWVALVISKVLLTL